MRALIENNREEIKKIATLHYVDSLAVFGSVAKNELNDDSDIDLLVEFSDSLPVIDYADNYFSLLENLERVFNRKVDLVTSSSLKNPILIDEILQTKIELYAA